MHRPHPIQILDALLAFTLAVLCGSVFLNVVLRFGFNSGITVTEEVSRILLVWLVMIGAVVVLYERRHIAMNMFVLKLSHRWQKAAAILGLALMLFCDVLLLLGAINQFKFSEFDSFPVTGWPLSLIYLSGIIAAVLFITISGWRLILLITGRLSVENHFDTENDLP